MIMTHRKYVFKIIYVAKWLQAQNLQKDNRLNDLIDQKLNNINVMVDEVQCVINVALLCEQIKQTKRPLMSHVLVMLEGKMDLPRNSSSIDQRNIPIYATISINESSHLLAYPRSRNCNIDIELTNLDPK
jgi:hypothetical protein